MIASNCETHCEAIGEKEEIGDGDRERRENLYWLVFRAIYREKPEKGLRVRDWKELSDAEVEAEVDRRFGTRQSRKRKSLARELLKWAALVAKVQIHEENPGGKGEVGQRGMG